MKKHILGLAVGIGVSIAPAAQALHLSSNGSGQVLLFPYYTVNSENQTLISIVNSTDRGKATRLFFREGRNSRVVMELSIYLAPYDVWTGAVFSLTQDGPANLLTTDNTCTVPALKTSTSLPTLSNGRRYAPFSNALYSGASDDAGPDDLVRTREGHFELIEMGEVGNDAHNTLAAITHGADGVPANCAQLEQAWAPGGYWRATDIANLDVSPPGGGLYGSAFFVDALGGTMSVVAADALDDFSGSTLHLPPGEGGPTLADVNTGTFLPTIAAELFVDGEPLTLHYPINQAIDAVSAILMADKIHNEFVTDASVGGVSEWVVTFPTKHFYTDVGSGPAIAPFTEAFGVHDNGAYFGVSDDGGSAPVTISTSAWTRAGAEAYCINPHLEGLCAIAFSPPPPPPRLAWATNVVGFNQPSSNPVGTAIFGSRLSRIYEVELSHPWPSPAVVIHEGAMRLSLWREPYFEPMNRQQLRSDTSGRRLRGLPVQGFWVARYTNGQLTPGVLSNYSDAVRHQSHAALSPSPE